VSGLTIGLMGAGEFDPWAEEVDRWLLERAGAGDGRVVIVPTASAAEGDDVFDSWGAKGLEHYGRLGVPAEVVPLKTREDASRKDLLPALDRASVVFFSGGNPAYLSATLRDTPFWSALMERLDRGLAYAGCSAGMACLQEITYDSDVNEMSEELFKPGLGLFRDLKRLSWVFLMSFLMFGVVVLGLQASMWALGIELPWYAGLIMLVITAIGIMVPAAPGYIGTMNVACIAGLALLRVGKDLAVPFSWFYWASQWAPVTLVGLWCLQREGLSLRSLGQAQEETP